MDRGFYDALAPIIVWSICGIVILRFWKSWLALFLEWRGTEHRLPALLRHYIEFKREHIKARREWAEQVIEQENNRQGSQ